ncbi:MAG: hypothetical protein VX790_04625 [Bacteroidota bacterium]|nr:hypothetical protein [Bacteroidota bacterium]
MAGLHSKRMLLIPEYLVHLLRERQQETASPVTKNLVSLKGQMGDILERQDLRPDEKVKLYGQAFQRYQNVRDQTQNKPLSVQIVLPASESVSSPSIKREIKDEEEIPSDQVCMDIIKSVPKTLKNRAELLLQKLKQHEDVVNWNDRGELIYHGKDVRGSNILDLVNDILRNRKTNPRGWEFFARGLAHMNIPDKLVQNTNRRRVIQQYKQEPALQPAAIAKSKQDSEEQDWTDEEILPNEDAEFKRLLFSPTVRKRKADKRTPHGKRSNLAGIKKRFAHWSTLPYGN